MAAATSFGEETRGSIRSNSTAASAASNRATIAPSTVFRTGFGEDGAVGGVAVETTCAPPFSADASNCRRLSRWRSALTRPPLPTIRSARRISLWVNFACWRILARATSRRNAV